MSARLGLAAVLLSIGQSTQALEHLTEMLRLDLDDNLDARYLMLGTLVNEGLDDAALSLLDAYSDEESAIWYYTKAFVLFRRDKIHREAERALKRAAAFNPFVPDFLLGRQPVPKRIPEEVGFGDRNEAINYAVKCAYLWQELPGALDWLRKTVDQEG